MKSELSDLSAIKKQLKIELPADEVQKVATKTLEKFRGQAKLKGFRPGKVPDPILRQHYGPDIDQETVSELVQSSWRQAVQDKGLEPVTPPHVDNVVFSPGAPFSYQATFEVRPIFEPQGYKGMTLSKPKIPVTEDEVAHQLEEIQRRFTQLLPAPEGAKAETGTVVTIDYSSLVNGKPFEGGDVKGYVVELGAGAVLKSFEDALLGAAQGETRAFELTYPDDYFNKDLASKTASFTATATGIKIKQVPSIDDELARQVGPYETLDQLKGKIREELGKAKDHESERHLLDQILAQLIEKNTFEIPEGLVQEELEAMVREAEHRLKEQGGSWEAAGVTPEDFRSQSLPEARRRIAAFLVLRAIAQKEGITVTPQDIEGRINLMATQARQPVEKVYEYYQSHGLWGMLQSEILEGKVLELVRQSAQVKEEVAPPAGKTKRH